MRRTVPPVNRTRFSTERKATANSRQLGKSSNETHSTTATRWPWSAHCLEEALRVPRNTPRYKGLDRRRNPIVGVVHLPMKTPTRCSVGSRQDTVSLLPTREIYDGTRGNFGKYMKCLQAANVRSFTGERTITRNHTCWPSKPKIQAEVTTRSWTQLLPGTENSIGTYL